MADPILLVGAGTAAIAATAITTLTALRGWHGWLDLKRSQLLAPDAGSGPSEIRELRERVRKLEAIADGLA